MGSRTNIMSTLKRTLRQREDYPKANSLLSEKNDENEKHGKKVKNDANDRNDKKANWVRGLPQ